MSEFEILVIQKKVTDPPKEISGRPGLFKEWIRRYPEDKDTRSLYNQGLCHVILNRFSQENVEILHRVLITEK